MNERVTFYVDGFNFYYGLKAKKNVDRTWLQAYWIDMVKLFSQFLGEGQILEKVVYFTASPLNADKSRRQGTLLNANRMLNGDKFEVVRGKYLKKSITCPNCNYTILRPEEKKTDVNISVRMVGDCVQDKTDILVLISGDSDLIPPIEFIQHHYPNKKVRVYFPPTISSVDLKNNIVAHKGKVVYLENNKNKFINSIISDTVTQNGKTYTIPQKWKM
jgi:uncharacterized LabA/DUF88 family protein